MTIQQMKERKRELGYTYEDIAQRTGLSNIAVRKIFCGTTRNPRYSTICALEAVLGAGASSTTGTSGSEEVFGNETFSRENVISDSVERESDSTGTAVYSDMIWEDERTERIDGTVYESQQAGILHEMLIFAIARRIAESMEAHRENGRVLSAPIRVQLDSSGDTIVRPDAMVVCDTDRILGNMVCGAPDLVIEVMEEASRYKDMYVKHNKYYEAGTREYWVVDAVSKKIAVYDLESNVLPEIYTFKDSVPIGIFGGTCEVDFAAVAKEVDFLYSRQTGG